MLTEKIYNIIEESIVKNKDNLHLFVTIDLH